MASTRRKFNFMTDVISIQEAADLLNLSTRQTTRLGKDGAIEAKLLGKQWAFNRLSVLDYKAAKEKKRTT